MFTLMGMLGLIMAENFVKYAAGCCVVFMLALAGCPAPGADSDIKAAGRAADKADGAMIQFFENGVFKHEKAEWRTRPLEIKDEFGETRTIEVQVVKIEALCVDGGGKMAPCAEAERMEVHEYDAEGRSLFRTYLIRSK